MSNEDIQLTPEEKQLLETYVPGYGASMPEDKLSLFSFLRKVIEHTDTTKLGFLKEEEIGQPKHPIRTFKRLALVSDQIIDNPFFKDFFNANSEIITSTSLSREGKLLNMAVIQRKQLEDITKPKKENKGWFKKKDDDSSASMGAGA